MEKQFHMDKEKLKFIVKNLESLVNCLKEELYSDEVSENAFHITPYIEDDVDEVYLDET